MALHDLLCTRLLSYCLSRGTLGGPAQPRLMLGVIVSYILFITVSYQHVNLKFLEYRDWSKAWLALPVLFTAFTYQVIIPTLMTYMERNVKKVRLAIILGTTIPLVIYLIWEFLILGIVPIDGPGGLIEAGNKDKMLLHRSNSSSEALYIFYG